jgi:hypothetical protein
VRQWRPFSWPLAVLAVLPLWRAVGWLTPLGPLSELTVKGSGLQGSRNHLYNGVAL